MSETALKKPRRPLLNYFGGKWRIAQSIIRCFPAHRVYVEPFGGGASVLLKKPRSHAEVYNDLDGEIVNLFHVARDHGAELLQCVKLTPYSRTDFCDSYKTSPDEIEQARRTLVRSWMGFSGNLTRPNLDGTPQRAGFRTYSKKRSTTPAHDWHTFAENLAAVIDRLRGVIIESRPAIDVMRHFDTVDTLHYVDPPYVHSTRSKANGYRYEMTGDDHIELSKNLQTLCGAVILSGYDCELYNELYSDWKRVEIPTYANGARKRTEVLWLNEKCSADGFLDFDGQRPSSGSGGNGMENLDK